MSRGEVDIAATPTRVDMESRRHRSGGGVPFFAPFLGGVGREKGHPSKSEARLPAACCESVSKDGGGGSCARRWVGYR